MKFAIQQRNSKYLKNQHFSNSICSLQSQKLFPQKAHFKFSQQQQQQRQQSTQTDTEIKTSKNLQTQEQNLYQFPQKETSIITFQGQLVGFLPQIENSVENESLMTEIIQLIKEQQYEKARESVMKKGSISKITQLQLIALLHKLEGNMEQALNIYLTEEIMYENANAMFNFALVLTESKQHEKALEILYNQVFSHGNQKEQQQMKLKNLLLQAKIKVEGLKSWEEGQKLVEQCESLVTQLLQEEEMTKEQKVDRQLHQIRTQIALLKVHLFYEQQMFKESVQILSEALIHDTKNPELANRLAFCYIQLKDIINALKFYDLAFEIDNSYVEVIYNKAQLLAGVSDHQQAICYFDKYIQLGGKSSVQSHFNKGLSYYHLKQFQKSIECFEEYLKTEASNALSYYYIGLSFAQLGQWQKAVDNFDLNLKYDPSCVATNNNKGCALCEIGKFSEAVECFSKLIEHNSEDSEALYYRGMAMLQQGSIDQGVSDIKKAMHLAPENQEYKMTYQKVQQVLEYRQQQQKNQTSK